MTIRLLLVLNDKEPKKRVKKTEQNQPKFNTPVANPVRQRERHGRGCKPRPAERTSRTGLQTPSGREIVCFYSACRTRSVRAGIPPLRGGTIKRHGRGCKPRPAERTSRTGLQTLSGRENVTDGVANPVRQRERHGRGCKPSPAERTSRTGLQTLSGRENVTDGVANPVRQRERHGRGCKPGPAERTSRTGLQTRSGRENVTDGVANPVRQRHWLYSSC
jgi:hypothetical protein